MATNGSFVHQDQFKAAPENYNAAAAAAADAGADNSNLSKDEVGWYFVEQYYTTLSKSPEKLHVRFCPPIDDVCLLSLLTSITNSSSTANALSLSLATRPRLPTWSLDVR